MSASRRRFLKWSAGTAAALAAAGCAGRSGGAGAPEPPQPPEPTTTAAAAPEPKVPAKPSTILILGGTGFLGPHLVESARARGLKITLFNRGKTNPHLFPDVEKLQGNRDGDLRALEGRSWDAVIDTSGYVPRIVRASAELLAPSVGHYVFISTISVYANFAKKGITEDHELAKVEDETTEDVRQHYGALKALCERTVEAVMPGKVANVRPGLIVGPGDPTDRFTYWPVRLARGGEVLAPGTGEDLVQVIDVRDLAAWVIDMVENRRAGVYNAVGPAGPLTMREMLERSRQAQASNATFTWVDTAFLEQQKVMPWQDMPAWIPTEGEYVGSGSVDSTKAIAHGLRFRPIEETSKDTAAWFQTQPAERQAKLRAGITPEREAEVLAAWHARDSAPKGKPATKGKAKAKP